MPNAQQTEHPEVAAAPPRHVPGEPWTRATMLDVLERSNTAVERALLVLYARQTADERAAGATVEHNGMGFGAFDAEILTSFAQQIEQNRWGRRDGQRLTEKQMVIARRKVKRYVGQLVEVANAKLGVDTPRESRKSRARVATTGPVEQQASVVDDEAQEELQHARQVYAGIAMQCVRCEDRRYVGARGQNGEPEVVPCPVCNAPGA